MVLLDDRDLRERASRIEVLVAKIDTFADPAAQTATTELLQTLLQFYGEGLARIVALVADRAPELLDELTRDDMVEHLLLLHGLHPVPVAERVTRALDEVRPYLQSHGGNVDLVNVEDGVAHLRLQGSCDGCPSSTVTLRLAIEEAIQRAAPDLDRVEAEGVVQPAPGRQPIVFVDDLAPRESSASGPAWTIAGLLPQIAGGGVFQAEFAGQPVLFVRLDANFYAYHHRCPGCDAAMAEATLRDAELSCPGCGRRYDVRRAGRCLDAPREYLEPIPLIVTKEGIVKIALRSGPGGA